MKKSTILWTAILSSLQLTAQTVVKTIGFEDVALQSGVNNGNNLSQGFVSEGAFFPNTNANYSGTWYWTAGFAATNIFDTTTAGYLYASYAGNGSNSSHYAIVQDKAVLHFQNQSVKVTSLDISNSTYAAISMKNGDLYAKKFGGSSGNDPDYFKVRIYQHSRGIIKDSVEVFLADFRSSNDQDFILKNWKTVQVSWTETDSIQFKLLSSDVGAYGINTPLFFALDRLVYETTVTGIENALEQQKRLQCAQVFRGIIEQTIDIQSAELLTVQGQSIAWQSVKLNEFPSGIYLFKWIENTKSNTCRLYLSNSNR